LILEDYPKNREQRTENRKQKIESSEKEGGKKIK
jgi:hypothetical protein